MSGFSVRVENRKLAIQLGKLAKALDDDLTPEMELIGNEIIERAKQSFEDQADPWGKAWKPLAPSTIARRGEGAQILRDTGALYNSLNMTVTKLSVEVGSDLVYAAIHQFGGLAGRGLKTDIPKRSYFPVDIGGRLEPTLANRLLNILKGKFD